MNILQILTGILMTGSLLKRGGFRKLGRRFGKQPSQKLRKMMVRNWKDSFGKLPSRTGEFEWRKLGGRLMIWLGIPPS